MRDLMNTISAIHAFGDGAAITATTNGASIDVTALNDGNDGLCFIVDVGTVTDGSHVFKLQDQIDGSTWNDVAATYVQTPIGQSNTVTSSTAAGTILKFGYLGNPNVGTYANSTLLGAAPAHKVLVRLVDTVTGATTGGYFTGVAVLGMPNTMPAA
jgi:hypothetical protein